MAAPTDEFTRIAREGQEAVTAAVTSWTEAAERYAKNFDPKSPLPTTEEAHAAMETGYDLAGKLLAGQHAYATTLVAASKKATERIADTAGSFAAFRAV